MASENYKSSRGRATSNISGRKRTARQWLVAGMMLSCSALAANAGPDAPGASGGERPAGVAAAAAAGMAAQPNQVTGREINAAQKNAVDKGLAYLAAHQSADGGFGGEGTEGPRHAGIGAGRPCIYGSW